MPARTYMIVDPRRDHSFRVPRPDLSVRIGTPNACTQCHRDRDDNWAAAKVAEWYGAKRRSGPHYGDAIQAGRIGAPGAASMLVAVATDRGQADIVRATAVSLLGRYLDQETLPSVLEGLNDESPLVRTTTLQALEPLPAETKLRVAAPLLDDPIRAVRIEAARLLAVVPAQAMSPDMRQAFASANTEYVAAQMAMDERAEAHHNLGLFHAAARRWVEAETAYRQAIAIDPRFVPAYVNLAELARGKGDTASEEKLLRQVVDAAPDSASANFAVGLFEVRRKRYAAALGYLNRAATLGPESARFSYVYAVALETTGQRVKAISVLDAVQQRHPWNRDVLFALASYLAVAGDRERALDFITKLIEAHPRDQRARELESRLTNSRE
jgi:tetratricopeptide (TPR) repeat protein